jgi:hypothetical protein
MLANSLFGSGLRGALQFPMGGVGHFDGHVVYRLHFENHLIVARQAAVGLFILATNVFANIGSVNACTSPVMLEIRLPDKYRTSPLPYSPGTRLTRA